jgi:hypothetical protein
MDLMDRVNDDSTANSYDLVGHRGIKSLGYGTSRHFMGIIKMIRHASNQQLTSLQVDTIYAGKEFLWHVSYL